MTLDNIEKIKLILFFLNLKGISVPNLEKNEGL
jgi:hypothetical protein